jgi:hypothetical protein
MSIFEILFQKIAFIMGLENVGALPGSAGAWEILARYKLLFALYIVRRLHTQTFVVSAGIHRFHQPRLYALN